MIEKIHKTEEEWKKILTPEQYKVMREGETEKPFSCELSEYKGEGVFYCAACDLPLFKSGAKFQSGTGWPSFYDPFAEENLILKEDNNFGMERTEVLCARCESHLGHVFDDGPPPTGKRYCLNGVTLNFKSE
jgi:peptide-methionine (R)-S-oxide reductase